MQFMITPGTLLLRNDTSTWWMLVSYNVVNDYVYNTVWLNVTHGIIVILARTSRNSLTRDKLSYHYAIIN